MTKVITTHNSVSNGLKRYQDEEFIVADIVEHKLYGKGKIISIEGVGEMSKISIKFRGNMIKKFVKKYANLKKTD